MKRTILLSAVALGVTLMSCKKTDPVTPAEPGSATIVGTVDAPFDLSNDTTEAGAYTYNLHPETVESGKLTFVVNSGDLDNNPDASYDYQDLIFTTSISAGAYSITVPAISTALTVTVYADEFNAAQRQYVFGDPDSFEEEMKEFSVGTITIGGVVDGVTLVRNISYED